jgi:Uma2 family endonuclease
LSKRERGRGGKPASGWDRRAAERDLAFISSDRLAKVSDVEKYLPFAPDLAVEVVSPTNTASEIQLKVDQYLAAGTRLVWVVYPDLRKVSVFQPGGASSPAAYTETLDGGDVLPGLKLAVADLFPPSETAAAPTSER